MSCNDDYLERLDSWFSMFKSTKNLSISEAKDLAVKIQECSSLKEKEKIQEELLVGTMNVLHKFIKDNGIFLLCDTGYVEFDDLISSLTLSWAQDLDSKILNVGRYSTLFSREYFEDVASKLGVTEVHDFLQMKNSSYFDALVNCYKAYDNNEHYPGRVFYSFKDKTSCDDIEKTLSFVRKGYEKYKDVSFINTSNSGLLGLYGMIFTYIVVREGRYGIYDSVDFTEETIMRMDVEDQILNSDEIKPIHRELLCTLYGFDGKGEKEFGEVASLYGVPRDKVRQMNAKALRKLRGDKKVRKYNK